jgi:HPt (histidine-containing phosphotransfer) domain-containing protein
MSVLALKQTPSAPPAPREEAIDLVHLSRMTLGERTLEREVLALFIRQAEILQQRMDVASPALSAATAHTIKGSAVGIGAWRVARAAEAVEQAGAVDLTGALDALNAAIAEASVAIAALLRTH